MDPIPSGRPGKRTYRRRRPLPAIIILVILATASVVVWRNVLHQAGNSTVQASCPTAPATPAGTPLAYPALDRVAPLAPAQVRVHTLNGTTQVGLAGRIALELRQYGFAEVGTPGNDPHYPKGNLVCFGQIRFGPNGTAAARTLSLLVPCAQLVRDNRQDATVDLALGSYFTDLEPSGAGVQALDRLTTWSRDHPAAAGGLESAPVPAPALPAGLLAGAHTFRC
ncbi:MAG TPA: envelope integrity protein Cei [Pseudonocardiaceae bacterium]